MSEEELIYKVNILRPNTYGNSLSSFIKSLDLRVREELLGEPSPVYNPNYLALTSPNDMVYVFFLFSIIDYLNGEYSSYLNTSSQFTSEWNRIAKYFNEKKKNTVRKIKLW